jgi:hypothetical protein
MSEKTTQASQLESALWNAADVLRGKWTLLNIKIIYWG